MPFNRFVKSVVLTMVFAISLVLNGCMNKVPAQESRNDPVPEVGIITLKNESVILTTELPGRVSSLQIAKIRPQVSGLIQKRLFTEGADVEQGQLLYKIDPALFQAEYENAQANLEVAKKSLSRAQASLEVSKANIEQQQSSLDFAKKNRQRLEELVKDGAVSITKYDQAVTEDRVAHAALKSAKAQFKRDKEAVAEAQSAIKQAEALVETAHINLQYTNINAPISGRIGRSNVTEGAIVTSYQPTPLSTIQQLDPIYVDVQQSTTELLLLRQRLKKGNLHQEGIDHKKVKIVLEDGSEYAHEGDLQFRDVSVDPTTGSVVLRIVVPNPDAILLPSMFVQAIVKEGIKKNAILVPQHAVLRNPKGNPYVLLVNNKNKVEQRMVTIDRVLGNRWLISTGLSAGERVILEGSQRVRPGDNVKTVILESEQKLGDVREEQSSPSETVN